MADQERDPRAYELMTVFIPDLSEDDTRTGIEAVGNYIGLHNGKLKETLTDSPWGRRRLAYTIRYSGVDYRDGFYAVYHFNAGPSQVQEIERALKLDANVMRYLLVIDDPRAGEKHTEAEAAGAEAEAATGEEAPEASNDNAEQTPQQSSETQEGAAEAPATEEQPEAAPAEASADGQTGEAGTAEASANGQTGEAGTAEASANGQTGEAGTAESSSNEGTEGAGEAVATAAAPTSDDDTIEKE